MEQQNMRSPILDVLGFASLLVSLPWFYWLTAGEPFARMLGSYGAGVIVVWRVAVLIRRAFVRWNEKRKKPKALKQ